jgi:ribonuclease Z
LTHLSRRYFERDMVKEAKSIFPNAYIARDFDRFQISREGTVRLERNRDWKLNIKDDNGDED